MALDRLVFPKRDENRVKQSYYDAYYRSVANLAFRAGIVIGEGEESDVVWCGKRGTNAFSCTLDGKQFIMDFSDFVKLQMDPNTAPTYFKWHYYPPKHDRHPRVFPISPLLHFNWGKFLAAREKVKYTASGDRILNNQRPRLNATERRNRVHKMLSVAYGDQLDKEFGGQEKWWIKHNDCLVAIAIPGAREDILDRGQLEEMGLGVCVVAPPVKSVLGHFQPLVPWLHFVPIKYDFSNLLDRVEWCKKNRDKCLEIGREAQKLFDSICQPEKYWEWIKACIKK